MLSARYISRMSLRISSARVRREQKSITERELNAELAFVLRHFHQLSVSLALAAEAQLRSEQTQTAFCNCQLSKSRASSLEKVSISMVRALSPSREISPIRFLTKPVAPPPFPRCGSKSRRRRENFNVVCQRRAKLETFFFRFLLCDEFSQDGARLHKQRRPRKPERKGID